MLRLASHNPPSFANGVLAHTVPLGPSRIGIFRGDRADLARNGLDAARESEALACALSLRHGSRESICGRSWTLFCHTVPWNCNADNNV